MKTRKLGSEGIEVPAIGLGCMGMTIQYGELDDEQSINTIHHALDIGVNLINSADMYGWGKNEELISKAIKDRRHAAILNTKFGQVRNPDGSGSVNGRPDYVQEACEASLSRLGTDYIDVYSQHRVDPDVPIEETVGAMSRLIEQGKVRYIGLSAAAQNSIRKAHATYQIVCVETEYSLWSRDVEAEILPTCQELGISLMAYAPRGRGFLSGAIRTVDDLIDSDRRRDHPRFSSENMEQNIRKVEVLEEVAVAKGFKPAQVAIAWVLHQDENLVPIPGTKRTRYLDENVRATDLELTDEDAAKLANAFPAGETAGERYPAPQMKRLEV